MSIEKEARLEWFRYKGNHFEIQGSENRVEVNVAAESVDEPGTSSGMGKGWQPFPSCQGSPRIPIP